MKGWHLFWLLWFSTSVTVFLAAESYALATNWRNTLSAAIWDLEKFRAGQPISQWSVSHYWFLLLYGGLVLWLFFHFGMGWWR